MSGLYVKLDAEYASDDKLILAGPLAELLYIRGLAFCKRQMVDGEIRTSQLPAVALGIPSARKAAAKLVEVGAWEATEIGWRITAWLSRNKSAAQIEEEREMRRTASVEANHAQHHVGPGKKASPKCELCRSEKPPTSAPISDPNRTRHRLQEEEPEPEEEPKPEPEEEEEPSVSPSEDVFNTAVELVVDGLTERFPSNGTNPVTHRLAIEGNVRRAHTETIRTALRLFPAAQPAAIAADVIREMT